MEENNVTTDNAKTKKCDGRCETCNINQRTYCASQIAYYNQQEIASIKAVLDTFVTAGQQDIITHEKASKNEDISVKSEPMTPGADE